MKTPLGYLVFVLTLSKYWSSVACLLYNIEVIPTMPGRPSIMLRDARPKVAHGEQYYSVVTTAQRYKFLEPPYFGGQLHTYVLRIGEGNGSYPVTFNGNMDEKLEVYRQTPFSTTDCTYWRVKNLTYEDWSKAKLVATEQPNENSPPCRYGCSSGSEVTPISGPSVPRTPSATSNQSQLNKQTCSICLEDLGDGKEVASLACKHVYCKDCIREWVSKNPTCPMCRAPVNEAKRKEVGCTIKRDDNDDYSQQYYYH